MAEKVARCPRCGSEELSVVEVHEEWGMTMAGRVVIRDGEVVLPTAFDFEAGSPLRTFLQCDGRGGCGHQWRCRWPISGTQDHLHASPPSLRSA